MSRRGATDLSGVLLIDKPAGMTSHDVVSVVRAATGERRVGHAGTLDPMATGLLVVLVGPATRLAPYLSTAAKTYRARIVFGSATDTDDSEGTVVRTAPVSTRLTDPEFANVAVEGLLDMHHQIPPAYSAIKVAGRTAHKAARAGEALDLAARDIEVFSAGLVNIDPDPVSWDVEITASKGTYIRAIARDLGESLGTAAHLGALRRTAAGALDVVTAVPLDDIRSGDIATLFTPALDALSLPVLTVDDKGAARVHDGRPIDAAGGPYAGSVAVEHDGRLLAVYTEQHATLRPETVFPGGVS